MSLHRQVTTGITRNCLELSQAEIDRLVIRELRKRHPGALAITIDYEARSAAAFCHCWWVSAEDGGGVHPKFEKEKT